MENITRSHESHNISCPTCVELKDKLKERKREMQKMARVLKTAQRQILRLKQQKQKLLTKKLKPEKKVHPLTFFQHQEKK